jgi:hypothetical protein
MWKYATAVDRQRLGKHVPAATSTQTTIEILVGYNNINGVLYAVGAEML